MPATTSRIDGAVFRRWATTATSTSTASRNSTIWMVAVIPLARPESSLSIIYF